jgi:GalNAc-alpha-(1->4)-GalNAc-alpha-(1->3)-diNAcBac-PP-undecaprenol alpha-1,4-N-acetyl-D-galactosaminyltransferase
MAAKFIFDRFGKGMKIIVLTSSLSTGGAERVASTLCNSWARRGDRVTLIPTFSGGGEPFYPLSKEVELIYLAARIQGQRGKILQYKERFFMLRRLIAERLPDVVVSFLPNVNVAAILVAAGMRVPVIICERSDPSQQPYTLFWKIACRATYRFADMLTVQTAAVAKSAADIFPKVGKIRAVANPLPSEISEHLRTPDRARKILLSLGRLSEEKQVNKIIDGFSDVCNAFQEWELHIYGDGPLSNELEEIIIRRDLQHRILLKGRTNNPWAVMAGADAFVMASRYEGFPNALLEAMGIGLPCIAFDCPSGPREISNDGRDAVLVPMNDVAGLSAAMEKLMSYESFRTMLGTQARNSVHERYSLDAVLSRWDDLFREVGAI